MQRSEINGLVKEAEEFLEQFRFKLPPWASWDLDTWRKESPRTRQIRERYLGWDLTDFGQGDFFKRGLLLFTIRNGDPRKRASKTYAEKILVIRDNQETPYHFHWQKTEDIINRGGGTLVLELTPADHTTEEPAQDDFTVYVDGIARKCEPRHRVRLEPGESITLEPYLYHRFWAEGGAVLAGEVSKVNDDKRDNRFLEPLGRFPRVEEDDAPYRLLVFDYDNPEFGLNDR